MTPLDPRFSKVVALMRSTKHAGKQKAAKSRAEAMAVAAGMTLEEALAVDAAPKSEWFDIFDRKEDAADRSWKAEQAARRRAKIAAWTIRRAALIAKYGSIDAATAPCERERLILAAVARWRTVRDHPRWTRALDGWTGWASAARKEAPAHVIEAIVQAYLLPATFAQAKAEHDYWTDRNQELEDAFSDDGDLPGNNELDLPTEIRAEIVRALAEHELPIATLTDLHARFAMYRESKSKNATIEAALFRDIGAMALREAQVSDVDTPSAPSTVHDPGRIEGLLKTHPEWSDRRIARATGCSPTTVDRTRRAIGATCSDRSVQRGGQVYTVHVSPAASQHAALKVREMNPIGMILLPTSGMDGFLPVRFEAATHESGRGRRARSRISPAFRTFRFLAIGSTPNAKPSRDGPPHVFCSTKQLGFACNVARPRSQTAAMSR